MIRDTFCSKYTHTPLPALSLATWVLGRQSNTEYTCMIHTSIVHLRTRTCMRVAGGVAGKCPSKEEQTKKKGTGESGRHRRHTPAHARGDSANILYATHERAHLLDLAELLVDAVVVVLHIHRRCEYLVLEFLGKAMQAPVLREQQIKEGERERERERQREEHKKIMRQRDRRWG